MATKQDLARRAGEAILALLKDVRDNGLDGSPQLQQAAERALAEATAAGVTAKEVRKAGGLDKATNLIRSAYSRATVEALGLN